MKKKDFIQELEQTGLFEPLEIIHLWYNFRFKKSNYEITFYSELNKVMWWDVHISLGVSFSEVWENCSKEQRENLIPYLDLCLVTEFEE